MGLEKGAQRGPGGRGFEVPRVQDECGVGATSWLLLELQGWAEQSYTRAEGGGTRSEVLVGKEPSSEA